MTLLDSVGLLALSGAADVGPDVVSVGLVTFHSNLPQYFLSLLSLLTHLLLSETQQPISSVVRAELVSMSATSPAAGK